jgi:hypothetical protein
MKQMTGVKQDKTDLSSRAVSALSKLRSVKELEYFLEI